MVKTQRPYTDKEVLVIELLCQGKSNLDIAEYLGLSINTIKTHVKHIYKKAKVGSRAQFIVSHINPAE